jgi:hypothetical protein
MSSRFNRLPMLVFTGFLLNCPFHVMPCALLRIKGCPAFVNTYIQPLNRVCSVWSYIESGYVYQYVSQLTRLMYPIGGYRDVADVAF